MFSLIRGHQSKTERRPCRNSSVKLQGGSGGVQVQGRSFKDSVPNVEDIQIP